MYAKKAAPNWKWLGTLKGNLNSGREFDGGKTKAKYGNC